MGPQLQHAVGSAGAHMRRAPACPLHLSSPYAACACYVGCGALTSAGMDLLLASAIASNSSCAGVRRTAATAWRTGARRLLQRIEV